MKHWKTILRQNKIIYQEKAKSFQQKKCKLSNALNCTFYEQKNIGSEHNPHLDYFYYCSNWNILFCKDKVLHKYVIRNYLILRHLPRGQLRHRVGNATMFDFIPTISEVANGSALIF